MKLVKAIPVILFLLSLSAGVSAAEKTYDTKIHLGETVEIGDYEVRYRSYAGENELTFGRWTETSFLVLERLDRQEVYDRRGDRISLSENLSTTILENGFDEDGRFVEIQLTGSEQVFATGELSTGAPSNLMISQGESATIPLEIENTGFLNQSYRLKAETDANIQPSFNYQGFNVTEIEVEEGESASVEAMIEVPETAELGSYSMEIKAISDQLNLSEGFQLEIRGREIEKSLELDLRESYVSAEPGSSVEVPVSVRSGGARYRPGPDSTSTLEDVTFEVETPDGWDHSLSPEGFSRVSSREVARATLSIEVPENAQSGDFFVDVSASSAETSMDEPRKVRVNVAQSSNLGVVGAVLMAFSLGLLVFVYRKFGRR